MKKMKFQRNCFLGCHRIYELKRYYAHAYIRKPPARTKEAKASTSFENVTSPTSVIIFLVLQVIWLARCIPAILELKFGIKTNWN